MANPRKFSEKIALHTQKQAEETAAFEAIMREVSGATRGAYHQKQHLHITQNLGAYRGGSLPNVNQIATNPGIDLQTALQNLKDIEQGRVGFGHRERGRQATPHRNRNFPTRTDCSPYGSAYLSPPSDSSWRRLFRHLNGVSLSRTNSDSALHTSAMNNTSDHLHGPATPPSHRRVTEMSENSFTQDMSLKGYWDSKKLVQSRPKSCEVPNINIYPSQEQDAGVHIPISNHAGSLPDLTVLQFPSPLATPLDEEEQNFTGNPANLSPTTVHPMKVSPTHTPTQQGSVSARRNPHSSPSPLVLSSSNQMRLPLSLPVSSVPLSKLTVDPRIHQCMFSQHHEDQLQQQQQQHHHHHQPQTFSPIVNHHHHHQQPQQPQHQHPKAHHHHITPQVHVIPPRSESQVTQPSLTQYRNSVSESNCQSPTSPLSQTSYSPVQSPGLPPNSLDSSAFNDAYYLQQQQTNALQHQLEQFSMVQDNQPTSTLNSAVSSNSVNSATYSMSPLNFDLQSLTGGGHDYQAPPQYYQNPNSDSQSSPQQTQIINTAHQQQQQQQQPLSPQSNKIPDIILTDTHSGIDICSSTASIFDQMSWGPNHLNQVDRGTLDLHNGADDPLSRQDFAKDLGSAITGLTDSFDSDLFPAEEALKMGLDPLDLDGLQMLTDPNLVADAATEDSFKLDRL